MSAAQLLDWSSMIALLLLGAALLLSTVRIFVGPTLSDRVLALDLMTVVAMGMVCAIAMRTGLWLYLDIAVALALLGFLATVALARFIMLRTNRLAQKEGR